MFGKPIASPHRPTHIYIDNTYYFVTGTVLHRAYLLEPATHKPYLQERIITLAPDYGLDLAAWVILSNHYRLLFHLTDGANLSLFFKHLHGQTSTDFNKWDHQPGRQFWYSYWDWCIRNERDYWQHFNYIHYNPIKHGYVQRLRDWPFPACSAIWKAKVRNGLMIVGEVIPSESLRYKVMISSANIRAAACMKSPKIRSADCNPHS